MATTSTKRAFCHASTYALEAKRPGESAACTPSPTRRPPTRASMVASRHLNACSPEAWSASAIIQICHMLTGAFALAQLRALIIDPALPDWMAEATIRDLRAGQDCVSIALHRESDGQTRHEILSGRSDCLGCQGRVARFERVCV